MEMITVTFDERGDPIIDVQGVQGKSCQEVTSDIENALGMVNKTTNLKPEAVSGIGVEKHLTQPR